MLLQEAADAGNLADVPIFCSGLGMDLCDYLDAASKKTKQVKFSRQVLRDLGILPLSRKYTQPGKNMPERGIYLLSSGMLVEKTPAWRVAANMLDHEENAVFFVGYCDPETPGGELRDRVAPLLGLTGDDGDEVGLGRRRGGGLFALGDRRLHHADRAQPHAVARAHGVGEVGGELAWAALFEHGE